MDRRHQCRSGRQRGVAAVEFGITAMVLFTFIFGVMEMARLAFVWNSLTQATSTTARGAASTPFAGPGVAALASVKQNAIFVDSPNQHMPFTSDIKTDNLVVDYLDRNLNKVVSPPSCQMVNLTNCATDPNANNCVRFVRVRLCEAGTNCTPVQYKPMIALAAMDGLKVQMPQFTAILPLEAQVVPGDCN